MNGGCIGVVLSPGGLAAAALRCGSPGGEPSLRSAAAKAGADPVPASRPDPEVVAKPKRRTYTAEYKQRILQESEVAATTRGGLGALLRREGLYSSLLTYWRRERAQGILEALTPQKRGPKSKRNPMEEEVQKLRRQNARLTEDLRKAHIIIDVQKKVAALLGHPIPEQDPEEKS
jgi:transposase